MITPSSLVRRVERINRIQLISSLFFSLIALIVGFSILTIYLYRDFEARRRELAILLAVGARKKQVLYSFILPLLLITIVSLVIGCVLSFYAVIPYYHELVYGYTRIFAKIAYFQSFLSTVSLLFIVIIIVILMLRRKVNKIYIMDLLRAEI